MRQVSGLALLMTAILLSGCACITGSPTPINIIPPDGTLMVSPPEHLEEIDPALMNHNDLRQALPVISKNYKTYHIIKAQLKGLQQYVYALLENNRHE